MSYKTHLGSAFKAEWSHAYSRAIKGHTLGKNIHGKVLKRVKPQIKAKDFRSSNSCDAKISAHGELPFEAINQLLAIKIFKLALHIMTTF